METQREPISEQQAVGGVEDPQTATTRPFPGASTEPIVARAGRYFRNTRYLMALLVLGFGIACIYDGWVGWPRQNLKRQRVEAELKAAQRRGDQAAVERLTPQRGEIKTATDLMIQKALGVALPPLAVLLLVRALYVSRGEYRLEAGVLHVPGHPPIPLASITAVDRKLWDRKGILYFEYRLEDGAAGRVKLDDFVYARGPTDAIVEQIKAPGAP